MKSNISKFNRGRKFKNDPFMEYYKDGIMAREGACLKEEKACAYKYYFKYGRLLIQSVYESGLIVGVWIWYRENGNWLQTGSFENGKKAGIWKRYYVTGELFDEDRFRDDKKRWIENV